MVAVGVKPRPPRTVKSICDNFASGLFYAEDIRCLLNAESLARVCDMLQLRVEQGRLSEDAHSDILDNIERRDEWFSYPREFEESV